MKEERTVREQLLDVAGEAVELAAKVAKILLDQAKKNSSAER